MTLFFCHGRSDEDELWHTDAELHADILKFGMTIAQKLTSKLNAVILNTREQIYLLNVYMLTELNSYLSYLIIIIIVFMVLHHGRAIARVHPVHMMNVEQRQVAADPRPSQTT